MGRVDFLQLIDKIYNGEKNIPWRKLSPQQAKYISSLLRDRESILRIFTQEEIGKNLAEELHTFLLKDSKVPDIVIDGVGKFIDFKKYLGLAAASGAGEAVKQADEKLRSALSE